MAANVLVWQQYGSVDVFAADTIPQLQFIVTRVGVAATGWGIDKQLTDLIELIVNMTPAAARRNVSSTVMQLCRGHESFEVFEFTTVQGAE